MHVRDLGYSQPVGAHGKFVRLYDDSFHLYGPSLKIPVDVYDKCCSEDARGSGRAGESGQRRPGDKVSQLAKDSGSAYQQKTPERIKEKSQPAISQESACARQYVVVALFEQPSPDWSKNHNGHEQNQQKMDGPLYRQEDLDTGIDECVQKRID
jgi:hypothetical protein